MAQASHRPETMVQGSHRLKTPLRLLNGDSLSHKMVLEGEPCPQSNVTMYALPLHRGIIQWHHTPVGTQWQW